MSKTRLALELLRQNPKMTQREAAQAVGLKTHSGVGAAQRQAKKTRKYRCKHCGAIIPYLKDALKKD